jgi:hypothetical protein
MLTLVGFPNIQRLYTAQQLRQAVPLAQPGTSPLELWPLPTSTVKEDDSYRQPEQSNRKRSTAPPGPAVRITGQLRRAVGRAKNIPSMVVLDLPILLDRSHLHSP